VEELEKSIDTFMAKFDTHILMNWGFGIDDSLKENQEVKFTLIATGFGIEAIPAITEWKDKAKQLIEDEKRKQIEEVESVYGGTVTNTIKQVSPSSIVVLTMDEMDNDAFINFLDENPTYNRSASEIAKKRKPAKSAAKEEEIEDDMTGDDAFGQSNIIKF
jgi:cell division protein FtsZ